MSNHFLQPALGSKRRRKRVGRGNGSGSGTTATRGTKGQQARAGKGRRLGFEGGQNPLLRRQPKIGGFRHPNHKIFEVINLADLEARLEAGTYDILLLKKMRMIHGEKPVKLLGRGKVTKKFDLTLHAVSASAKTAIEKAGGNIILSREH